MELTKLERETVVTFNEAEPTAAVYTHNPPLIRRLKKLAVEKPKECSLAKVSHEGLAYDFTVPKAWVKVSPPRKLNLTDEERQKISQRLNTGREKA